MLERFLVPKLQRLGIPLSRVWFQQDGATPHTARAVLDYLNETSGARLLLKNTYWEWPPRSPDLTTPDFFLLGLAEDRAYRTPPNSLTPVAEAHPGHPRSHPGHAEGCEAQRMSV